MKSGNVCCEVCSKRMRCRKLQGNTRCRTSRLRNRDERHYSSSFLRSGGTGGEVRGVGEG